MACRNPEPLDEELKCLKLNILDMISNCLVDVSSKQYIPYLAKYEAEIEALVGLPEAEQRKGLQDIVNKVIALYKRT